MIDAPDRYKRECPGCGEERLLLRFDSATSDRTLVGCEDCIDLDEATIQQFRDQMSRLMEDVEDA